MKRLIAVPVFAALLVGAAFAGYHSHLFVRLETASPASATDLFAQLPTATSPAAVYVDVKALRTSPFFSKIAAMAPSVTKDADYATFVNATGFNYETDLDQIAVVTDPATQGNTAQVVAQGNFDEQKIAAYAQSKGKLTAKSGSHQYEFMADNPPRKMTMEFLSANRLRVTSTNPGGSGSAAKGTDATAPIPMSEHIARVNGSAFFIVFHVDGMKGMNAANTGPIQSPQVAALLRSIQWVTLTGNPEASDLRISIEGDCDTAANAQQLAAGLNTLKMMAPMFLSQSNANQNGQPQISPQVSTAISGLISSLQISNDDTRAKLSLLLTQQMIDAASTAAKARSSSTQ